jgi:hypothetical protein
MRARGRRRLTARGWSRTTAIGSNQPSPLSIACPTECRHPEPKRTADSLTGVSRCYIPLLRTQAHPDYAFVIVGIIGFTIWGEYSDGPRAQALPAVAAESRVLRPTGGRLSGVPEVMRAGPAAGPPWTTAKETMATGQPVCQH